MKYYVCPTCESWRYLEVYGEKTCYCRRCEEGCVKPLLVEGDPAGTNEQLDGDDCP